jgi:hypothetical protein
MSRALLILEEANRTRRVESVANLDWSPSTVHSLWSLCQISRGVIGQQSTSNPPLLRERLHNGFPGRLSKYLTADAFAIARDERAIPEYCTHLNSKYLLNISPVIVTSDTFAHSSSILLYENFIFFSLLMRSLDGREPLHRDGSKSSCLADSGKYNLLYLVKWN